LLPRQGICPFIGTAHAANIGMWFKRDIKFDPAKAELTTDPPANRRRRRAMREPWMCSPALKPETEIPHAYDDSEKNERQVQKMVQKKQRGDKTNKEISNLSCSSCSFSLGFCLDKRR